MYNEIYNKIDKKLALVKNIAIITHRSPDGDAIWSATALLEVIETNFSKKRVDIINIDWYWLYSFLPNYDRIIKNFDKNIYDLIFVVDCATLMLSGLWDDITDIFGDLFLINIDHHTTNDNFWNINLVDSSKPSTTLVLYDFFDSLKYKINKKTAMSLLTWVYTDTWAYIYSNVTSNTFNISSKLFQKWADNNIIDKEFFSNLNFNFLKIYSLALERFRISHNYAISYLTNKDLEENECNNDDVWSIVSRLNMIDNIDIKYVLFLHEKDDIVKWSLRTNTDEIDLIQIARKFSWGWHKRASGFIINWKIVEIDWRIWVLKDNKEIIYFT